MFPRAIQFEFLIKINCGSTKQTKNTQTNAGPPGMGPMNPRMNPPRGPGMGPMGAGTYGPGMRGPPPNSSLGPGGMPPMGMAGGRPQWQPNTSSVSH